jgi:predicted NAD/FAD-dependent oxidoreductase
MNALVTQWAAPLVAQQSVELETRVTAIESDALQPRQWQLQTQEPGGAQHVFSGFDAVLLALPSVQAAELLNTWPKSEKMVAQIEKVRVAPCWTLMVAFPQAVQPGLTTLGPQWNAARSTHHRISWLARESSKPRRSIVERWTVQASPAWSQEHLEDDPKRVQAKLLKAFSEVTGIRAEPSYVDIQRWRYAQTVKPLGKSHLWDAKAGVGVCGDWCLGHRVEDAFISGLELALTVA